MMWVLTRWSITAGGALLFLACADSGTEPEEPRYPSAILAVSALDLQGPVGQPLSDPSAVRVLDQRGDPLPGVRIDWIVGDGNGAAYPLESYSDDTGVARTIWTLGTHAGIQKMVARQGSREVLFTAAAAPGPVASLVSLLGDEFLSGVAGAAISSPPSVRVLDMYENPVAEVAVHFRVEDGGGSAANADQTTDGEGEATVGSWTLGLAGGWNVMSAVVVSSEYGGGPATFSAYGFPMFSRVPVEGLNQPPYSWGVFYNRTRGRLTVVHPEYGIGEISPGGGAWTRLQEGTPIWGWTWAAVHEAKQRILVMSGDKGAYYWDYNDREWTPATVGEVPTPRTHVAMVYDSANQRILVHGGAVSGGSSDPVDDLFAWDGDRWTRLPPPPLGPRASHKLAYDSKEEIVYLHGGVTVGTAFGGHTSQETWALDKSGSWERLEATMPLIRNRGLGEFGFAFDEVRGSLIVAGGMLVSTRGYWLNDEVWELIDGHWRRSHSRTPIGERASPNLVYAPDARSVILFGAANWGGNDIWKYGSPVN